MWRNLGLPGLAAGVAIGEDGTGCGDSCCRPLGTFRRLGGASKKGEMGGRSSRGGILSFCFRDESEGSEGGGCGWSTLGGTGGAGDNIALSGGSGRDLSKSMLSVKGAMGEG